MSASYLITVAVKYDITLLIENETKEDAEEQALNDATEMIPVGAVIYEGCPFVIATRERGR